MEEQFNILKEYFTGLEEEKILSFYKGKQFINMDWVYSKRIDKEIIKETLAELLSKVNPKYKYTSNPTNIQGFGVILQEGRMILQAIGADKTTRLSISDVSTERDNQNEKQVPLITLDDLADQIADKLLEIEAYKKIDELGILGDSAEHFLKAYKSNPEKKEQCLQEAKDGFKDLFQNLQKYYNYLVEYSNFLKEDANNGENFIIKQRLDKTGKGQKRGGTSSPRVNDIIDFVDRAEVLKQEKPGYIRIMGEEKEDTGEIIKNSYTTFIYRNALEEIGQKKNGWLFVCEPQRGDRLTRLIYLTDEEFEKFSIGDSDDRIGYIIKHYLDMSQSEFNDEKKTVALKHTAIKQFKEKIRFFIQGDNRPKSPKGKDFIGRYYQSLCKLYGEDIDLPQYKPRKKAGDIGKIGEQANTIDRTAQKEIEKKKSENQKV